MLTTDKKSALYTLTHGDGAPVILLHGMAASNRHWQLLLHELALNGFQGFAPDLPGHGDSPKPDDPTHYTAREIYAVFERWLEGLAIDRPVHLVGHSLGGFLSLLFACNHPERTASLVLIDPFISQDQLPFTVRLINKFPGFVGRVLHRAPSWIVHLVFDLDVSEARHFSSQVRYEIAGDYLRASPNFVYLGSTIWDLTPMLPQIQTPTLLIWGEQDRTLNPGSFPRLALQMPNVKVYPIAKSGHQPQIGQAELVNRRVIEFLRAS